MGAVVCTIGVGLLAVRGTRLSWTSLREPAAVFGLAAGGMLGLASVAIRSATGALGPEAPAAFRALVALAVMNSMQTVLHGGYLAARESERRQVALALRHWRSSAVVGVLSVTGSACWAIALHGNSSGRRRASVRSGRS